jgi:hypothetical protein
MLGARLHSRRGNRPNLRFEIEFEAAMVERNAGVPADRRIAFRVGVHLGDVVEEADGDLMGEGVRHSTGDGQKSAVLSWSRCPWADGPPKTRSRPRSYSC